MNSVVSVASVASASAIAAPGAGDDPIFAAIERHRQTLDRYLRILHAESEAEDAADIYNIDNIPPEVAAARAACEQAYEEENAAQLALINTVPTTMDGVLALIDHVEEVNAGEIGPADVPILYSSSDSWMDGELEYEHNDSGVPAKCGTDGRHYPFCLLETVGNALREIFHARV